jgi:hypothetical protein
MSSNSLNPYSNVENLNLKNISNEDKTPIYHINIQNLSINDIFIDKYNHYWSISQELLKLTTNKNPLTNKPFDDSEWIRIQNAINWYKDNQKEEIKVYPIPQVSMNNRIVPITNTNTNNTNTTNNTCCCERNCYITPVHGFVNNICFCFPFCSFDCGDKELTICRGNGKITCNNKVFEYSWNNICTIFIDNISINHEYIYFPYFCCGYDKDICNYTNSCCFATPICCSCNNRLFFLGLPIC